MFSFASDNFPVNPRTQVSIFLPALRRRMISLNSTLPRTYIISKRAGWVFYVMIMAMCLTVPVLVPTPRNMLAPNFTLSQARILREFVQENL